MNATDIQVTMDGRYQYIQFRWFGASIYAARYERAYKQFTPWMIAGGREYFHLPPNQRGRLLSKLWRSALQQN